MIFPFTHPLRLRRHSAPSGQIKRHRAKAAASTWRFALVCALGFPAHAFAQSAEGLPLEIRQALEQAGVPPSAVSMVVAPLPPPPGTVNPLPAPAVASGESNPVPAALTLPPPLLSWQADTLMNPASVMKLVTTYAGLDLLGPAYFWKTRVFTQGFIKNGVLNGDLLIKGSGDPKLVLERLDALIHAIRDKGVRSVNGDILLDNSVFRLPPHDPSAFDDDPLRPYNAGPDGLLVNFKALVFKFTPEPGKRSVRVSTEPPISGVKIDASVPAIAGRCGDWRTRLEARFDDPNSITFSGRYPSSCGEQSWSIAYADPTSFAPRVIEAMWRNAGGQLTGQVKMLNRAAAGKPLVTGYSLPLADIVADINKFSNNVMAQQLFLTLSSQGNGHGSFNESRNLFARWWRERFGMRTTPVVENGSGLSRKERVTAAGLTALLQRASASPEGKVFEQSLSIAGVDGTTRSMANRNPASEAIGNARLKTGTLRDVSAIAGYATGRSGHRYSVVGIINHPNAPAARPALDRLVEWAVQN